MDGHIFSEQARFQGKSFHSDTIHDIQNKPYVWVIRQNKITKVDVHVLEQRYSDNTAVVQGLQSSDLVSRVSIKFSACDHSK